jgi:hypothetical protein
MNRLDGFSLLLISVSCCILVSLGYVCLCRSLTEHINDPGQPEFWQWRNLALQWRDPAEEARRAFAKCDLRPCDSARLTAAAEDRVEERVEYQVDYRADNRMADLAHAGTGRAGQTLPVVELGLAGGFAWPSEEASHQARVARWYRKFVESSTDFARSYNRELARLISLR